MNMHSQKEYNAHSIEDMDIIAKSLIKDIEHPLILFIGELGAGKTSMIKALLKVLESSDPGSSPSYALINEYKLPGGKAYHIDLYRLNSAEEVFQLGIEEIMYSGDYCFIEWPQLIEDYIDMPYNKILLEVCENNMRKITLV